MRKKITLMLLILIVVTTLRGIPRTQAAGPVVTVTSVYNVTEPGVTFLVNITITGATSLCAWAINLTWDPDVIKLTTGDPDPNAWGDIKKGKYNIYEGAFLRSIGDTIFTANRINNKRGEIEKLACAYATSGVGASGDGVLATMNFTSVNNATTTIDINGPSGKYPGQSQLIDNTGVEIVHEDRDGTVTEQGPPPPQIWTQLWFQVTIVVVVVVIIVATAYVRRKKKIAEYPPESEEGTQ